MHLTSNTAIVLAFSLSLAACSTNPPFHDWGHKLQSISQYGGTKRDVSMMFRSGPKYCELVPGKQYHLGLNFDAVHRSNHINFVHKNSPAYKQGVMAGERVVSVDGTGVKNYDDIRMLLPFPLGSDRPVTIRTDTNTYSITPGIARVEQCYWDTRDGSMEEIKKGEVSLEGPQARSFRATCRIIEGYVSACNWNLQDSSSNM